MLPQHEETAYAWIQTGRDAKIPRKNGNFQSSDWPGLFVSHLIPPLFEAYAKILHRIDAHYEHIDNPLSPGEIAILKIPPCEPLKSFVEQRRANEQGTRIKWRELTELLNVPFAPEISHEWYRKKLKDAWCWPRLLYGPSDGTLGEEDTRELSSILQQYTATKDCFFRFSDIIFYAPRNADMPRLFKGTLGEYFPDTGAYRIGPEYWWPCEKNWCVCSEYDLKFTVVGGSKQLISALLNSSILECLEVTSRTRADQYAPMP